MAPWLSFIYVVFNINRKTITLLIGDDSHGHIEQVQNNVALNIQ